MKSYYQAIAAAYAHNRNVHPEVLRCLISKGELSSTSSVLDVGCGTGNYLLALCESVDCNCWGIDSSAAMLAEAQVRATKARLFNVPAERIDLPSDQFDLVFSVDVIHHIADRPRVFRECRRILRDGGRLCLVTESTTMIRQREPHATYFPEAIAVELARYPSIATLRTELQEAGFIDIAEIDVEFLSEIANIEFYRAKVHSSLQLISKDSFTRGIERLERNLRSGPIPYVWRYVLLWANKAPKMAP